MSEQLQFPHDAAAERAVIGCMVLDPECIADVSDIVQAEDFFSAARARIFDAVMAVHRLGNGVETSLVLSELASHGVRQDVTDEVMRCTDTIPTKHEAYATRVRKLAVARRLMRTALEVASDGGSPIGDVDAYLDDAEAKLREACDQRGDDTPVITMGDAVAAVYEQYQERSKHPGGLLGTPSGIADLDEVLCGFQAGKLYVVAGRPGHGKTSLAMQVAIYSAERTRKPSLAVSLEMTRQELAQRAVSARSGIDSRRIARAELRRDEQSSFSAAANDTAAVPMLIVDKPSLTETAIRRMVRKQRNRSDIGLVVVDYLQLVRPAHRHDNREREVAEMSRAFKELSMELRLPVVLCCQLNRKAEERSDKRPIMSDLRESGAIEQDADVIVFVFREELHSKSDDHKGMAELIVSKHRGGPVGTVKCAYHAQTTTFRAVEQHRQAPPYEDERYV